MPALFMPTGCIINKINPNRPPHCHLALDNYPLNCGMKLGRPWIWLSWWFPREKKEKCALFPSFVAQQCEASRKHSICFLRSSEQKFRRNFDYAVTYGVVTLTLVA